jgi:DNA mismatch repair protein MutS2
VLSNIARIGPPHATFTRASGLPALPAILRWDASRAETAAGTDDVNEKTLQTLEYDKVIARLAGFTSFPPGRERALDLRPAIDHGEAVRRQRVTAEARRLREIRPNIGLGGARDVRESVARAALGGVLEPLELLDVRGTLVAVRNLRGNVTRLASQAPLLADTAKRMDELGALGNRIDRTINQRGEVMDGASPVLAQIRRDVRVAHDRLTSRLNELLASAVSRGVAQESIITLRDGRYVIPVKADFRGQLRGIVHDTSSSGATVFIEPLVAVELGNTWRELQLDEQREIERILRALSAEVGSAAARIQVNVECLAAFDLAFAKARLGEALGATDLPYPGEEQPWLVPGPAELVLAAARHPLLRGDVVPTSLHVGGAFSVLLITGPNTGGKTVALKTAGLLTLMALAGLPVPAEIGTRIPVYDSVHADIGDEQSIEQSLSTFSSHMRNIITILVEAGRNSLVLLDELGAGTDPTEGAALARGIVEHLRERGTAVIATTHHGELKLYAHGTAGVMNASVEFDPETFAPTYKLTIGLPGRSNALAIARRLGMPERIIDTAREQIAPEQVELENLLGQLQRERDEAASARRAERLAAQEAQQIRDQLARRLDEVEATREEMLASARQELEDEVASARERLREATRRLSRPQPQELPAAQEAVAAAEEQIKKFRRRASRRRREEPGPRIEELRAGDQVWMRGLAQPGEALSAADDRGEIEVQFGALRTRVKVDQIARVVRQTPPQHRVSVRVTDAGPAPSPGMSIEVRGQRVEEAMPRVEEYIDSAFRAGLPYVRIVHGKGTGTLRRVVREYLSGNPLVTTFETAEARDGGEGVTVAHLAV